MEVQSSINRHKSWDNLISNQLCSPAHPRVLDSPRSALGTWKPKKCSHRRVECSHPAKESTHHRAPENTSKYIYHVWHAYSSMWMWVTCYHEWINHDTVKPWYDKSSGELKSPQITNNPTRVGQSKEYNMNKTPLTGPHSDIGSLCHEQWLTDQ